MNLREAINVTKTKGDQFLDIREAWSDRDTRVFSDGVMQYMGDARVAYCETTGLTLDFIEAANTGHLVVALNNVGAVLEGGNNGDLEGGLGLALEGDRYTRMLRQRLRLFLWYG